MDVTLQGIFSAGFETYKERQGLSVDQYRVAQAIMECRTEMLGHEEWVCPNDAHVEQQYHSCRNRSCPRCHGARTQAWLEAIGQRLLPCDHYHVVVTLPHELNPVWHFNRAWCADRLLRGAAETLRQLLADDRHLGAEIGVLASLHTWGRTLNFHPHVHLLVTGGGLSGGRWKTANKDFLLPVGVVKAKFHGKWLSWLNDAYHRGDLQLPPDWSERDWKKALTQVARKRWNVRIQGAYRHGQGVAVYLSRYVGGGPIKDSRLVTADDAHVCFRYRDHRSGHDQMMVLDQAHFLTRVLWHVPIKGQHTVRYYGLYVPGAQKQRDLARAQLGAEPQSPPPERPRRDHRCPKCGVTLFHRSSTRRKFSSIRNAVVQQSVQVDRVSAVPAPSGRSTDPPTVFLGRAAAT